MAYVRRRGSQIAIVAGERNPDTKQVEQRVLFTLYSRPEALDVLGRGEDKGAAKRFEMLMARQHPGVVFDWKGIRKAIAADLDHLPASYEYKESRLTSSFRKSLVELVRSLMLADPQQLASAGALIRENRAALGYLSHLIEWRTATCAERAPNQWTTDNPYFWRFSMPGKGVPPDVEEHVAGLRERGDTVHAEAGFELMVEAFPNYAAGYNFLGLLALERNELERAEASFRKTIELGRKLFPKRIARSSWWSDDTTRPYIRGLRNLANTLLRGRRYEEASVVVERLERECADDQAAASFRGLIGLNTNNWEIAAKAASSLSELWPEEGLIAALARAERREYSAALEAVLHAVFNRPRAVAIVLGLPSKTPTTFEEISDHNSGVHFRQSLAQYLAKTRPAVVFLQRIVKVDRVARSLKRLADLRGRWFGKPHADRTIFDEIRRMEGRAFAASEAQAIANLGDLALEPKTSKKITRASKSRHSSMH